MNYFVLPGLKTKCNLKFDLSRDKACEVVKEAVLKHFNFTVEKITSKSRKIEMLYPRQVLMYLLKQNTSMTLKEIGEMFDTDHTTVISNMKRIRNRMDTEDQVRYEIRTIQSNI